MQVAIDSGPPRWSPDGSRLAFSAQREGVYGVWVVGADGRDLRLMAERASQPVWAPRGSRIAFVGERPEAAPIEIVDADDGSRLRVTGEHLDSSPTWSPDARSLAFVRYDASAGRSDLYRIAAVGGSAQHLAGGGELSVSDPVWSPRGAKIVFSEGIELERTEIKTVGADGGVPKALAFGTRPAWSPDGRRIAFVAHSAIHVMNADGSARHKVREERPAHLTAGPGWSRDGKTLLFASMRDGADHELFVVNADRSQRRQLTSNTVEDVLPAWSPAHTRIAFARETGRNDPSIWIMSASGANQHRLGVGAHPSWSPRGSRLAFERRGVVYTMTNSGRDVRRITEGGRPVWAPRGRTIALVRDTELFVADADTGSVRRLADLRCGEGGTALSSPEWSPDGSQLVVPVECDYGKWSAVSAVLVDAGSGGTRYLPIVLALSRVGWSPDGARLAVSLGNDAFGDAPRIAATRLDGSARRTVTSGSGDDRDPDW